MPEYRVKMERKRLRREANLKFRRQQKQQQRKRRRRAPGGLPRRHRPWTWQPTAEMRRALGL